MTDQNDAPNSQAAQPAPDLNVEAMIRNYERKYSKPNSIPSLDDLLNDRELDQYDQSAEQDDLFEERPTSDDFVEPLEKPKRHDSAPRRKPIRSRTGTTDEERRWATIAHASALLTLFLGVPSAGFMTLITLFIPLGIYFYWRKKSEYVAFQALQAFTLQVLGTVGWLVLLTVGMLIGALLLVILAITIVGLILYPVVIPAMILFAVGSFALPLGMIVYSMIAAFQTWQGVDYRLPRIGKWIDNQMHSHFLSEV